MHGRRGRQFTGGHHATYVDARTVNITNVTNVVADAPVYARDEQHDHKPHKHRHKHRKSRGRPPRLLRYAASGGLLDYDVAAGMSRGELMEDSVRGLKYAAHGLSDCARGMASDFGKIGKGLFQIIGAFFQ